ncbi:hypothetical protein H8959_019900 [Pygathrix nigripes]
MDNSQLFGAPPWPQWGICGLVLGYPPGDSATPSQAVTEGPCLPCRGDSGSTCVEGQNYPDLHLPCSELECWIPGTYLVH